MVFKVAKSAIIKLFGYKNGALFMLNGSFSAAAVMFYFDELLKGAETKKLILPIVVFVLGFFVYHFFSLIDLATGLMNAKYQNSILPNPKKSYIKNYRLWFTIWKNLGITVFAFMVMLICLLTEIIDIDWAYTTAVWLLVTVWFMGSSFEFHSIGDNIEKRTGSKPAFFEFVESLTNVIQNSIILRVKKSFKILDTDEKKQVDIDKEEDEDNAGN